MYFLFLLVPLISFSKVEIKKRDTRSIQNQKPVTQVVSTVKSSAKKVENLKTEEDLLVEEFLKKEEQKPAIFDFTSRYDVKSGTVIKGRLLNSVVSTNLDSPVIVELLPNKYFPDGTRVICKANTKHSRIHSHCSKLITPEVGEDEYSLSASLLNLDGSAGIKPDEISNEEEKYVVGEIVRQGIKSATTWGQALQETAIGDMPDANAKNRLLNGIGGAIDASSNISTRKMQTLESKALAIAGKEIFVYFEERFKK